MKFDSKNIINRLVRANKSIAPLITFRILFGALMLFGTIRFLANGWLEKLYLEPKFFFKFYGFEWVKTPDEAGLYFLVALILLSSALIMIGFLYRFAIITFFLSFTYFELLDATNYLNHYYLVILLAFLMIFLPANRSFSIDAWINPEIKLAKVPAWTINILIAQLTIVYTFAGLAKLNADWLFQAMPLAIWLPEHTDIPILGYFFQFKTTAFAFSWIGAFYDLTIAYFLMFRKTRPFAYFTVIAFHGLTWMLFNIGLFPLIMISSTLIFFPAHYHEKGLAYLGFKKVGLPSQQLYPSFQKILKPVLLAFFIVQMLLPLRHLVYPGRTLWTEEGYRFSWRVMLVEKSGLATFKVADQASNRKTEIINGQYLTLFQEKQMSIQPDFILQFAHFLKQEYREKHGFTDPIVTVDAHVAINGRTSQRFIDAQANLASIEDNLFPKKWILPFENQ